MYLAKPKDTTKNDEHIVMHGVSAYFGGPVDVALLAHKVVPSSSTASSASKRAPVIIPFWFVNTTPHEAAANVVVDTTCVTVQNDYVVNVPMLRNTAELTKGG